MANKFVLIPDDIWRGLMGTDTGNPTLDFSRRALDNVQNERADPITKNIHYNQELRRYLHFRKEHEEKPVPVKLSGQQYAQPFMPIGNAANTTSLPTAPTISSPPSSRSTSVRSRRRRRPWDPFGNG